MTTESEEAAAEALCACGAEKDAYGCTGFDQHAVFLEKKRAAEIEVLREKAAAYDAQEAELQRWKTWAAHLCPNDHMCGDDARDHILAGLEKETHKAREYDAAVAEAAKIQPSGKLIGAAIATACSEFEEENGRKVIAAEVAEVVERERLLGVLRERALRKALENVIHHLGPPAPTCLCSDPGECEEDIISTAQSALNAAPPASDAISKAIEELRKGLAANQIYPMDCAIIEALRLLGEQP